MRKDILDMLEKKVKIACDSSNNFFGAGIYYHIIAVVKNAVLLAEKYNCDMEVVAMMA